MADIEKNLKSVVFGDGENGKMFCNYLREVGVKDVTLLSCKAEVKDHTKFEIKSLPLVYSDARSRLSTVPNGTEAVYYVSENNQYRAALLECARFLGYKTPSYIHPTAKVDPSAALGTGVYIMEGAEIGPCLRIWDSSILAENVRIAKSSVISPGVSLGAGVVAEYATIIGEATTVNAGVTLGEHCIIGGDSVVTNDIPAYAIAEGNPAKILNL